LKKEDEEKTSFTTLFGTYCFVRMPEGPKNTGSSFARMTKVVLGPLLDKNIIAYVNDIVVTGMEKEDHTTDLIETFANLQKAGLKLNPEKCTFRVSRGKVLGCVITTEGVHTNTDKTKAIYQWQSLRPKRKCKN
jgi:hypothetical protein